MILTSSPCQPTRVTLESRKKVQLYRQKQPKNTPFNVGLSSFAKLCAAFTLSFTSKVYHPYHIIHMPAQGAVQQHRPRAFSTFQNGAESRASRAEEGPGNEVVCERNRTALRTCHLL